MSDYSFENTKNPKGKEFCMFGVLPYPDIGLIGFTLFGYHEATDLYGNVLNIVGGDEWDINNVQTLCSACNKIKTRQDAADIAKQRRVEKLINKGQKFL